MKSYGQKQEPHYTAVTCPNCGTVDEVLDPKTATCAACGSSYTLDTLQSEAHNITPATVSQKLTKEGKTMSEYQIVANVPDIPHKGRMSARTPKYPFAELEVGSGFFVEGKNSKSFGSAVNNAMKRTGNKFKMHTVEDAGTIRGFERFAGKAGVIVARKDS